MNLGSASVFLVAVSFVSPTATIRHVDAQANVVYMQPAAKTSYMEVKVQAEVTFPDIYAVDVITPTDLVTLAVSKGFNDSITNMETTAFTLTKALADSLTLTDSFYEDLETLADSMGVSDTQTLATTLGKDDNVSTSSSGILVMQNYSDITYFLEDYVGSSTSFT